MTTCYSSIDLCAMRVVELDAEGAPVEGSDTLYVTDIPILANVGFVVAAGESFELRNGCGAVCATFEDCDRVKSATLGLELCQLEAELIVMMTGYLPVNSGGAVIGWELPGADADCPSGAGVELWSKAWDTDEQAVVGGNLQYFRHVFPKVRSVVGNFTLQHEILRTPVNGKATANSQYGDGPGSDMPRVFTNAYGNFLDDSIPSAECGSQAWAS